MRHPLVLLAVLVACLPIAALADDTWEPLGVEDGIATFRRDVPGSPVVAIKGDGIVDAPFLRVLTVLLDTKRIHEWTDSLAEARRLRTYSLTEYVVYTHIKTPFVLKDRDFVVTTKIELLPKEKKVVLRMHSVPDPAAPLTDYVRGDLMESTYVVTMLDHGARARLVASVHADPKGSVAKWIVNHYQKAWAHDTITRLRAQVKKPDIQDDLELQKMLEKAGYFE